MDYYRVHILHLTKLLDYLEELSSHNHPELALLSHPHWLMMIPEYTELQTIEKEERELYLLGEQSLEDGLKNFEERRAEVMN